MNNIVIIFVIVFYYLFCQYYEYIQSRIYYVLFIEKILEKNIYIEKYLI